MKIVIYSFILILMFFISFQNSVAGELTYTCTVVHAYKLDVDSSLKSSNWEKDFKNSQFSISRIDGQITGKVVPTFMAKSTHVHNKGDKVNAFKASADFGDQFQLIEVQEFIKGEQKPFIALSLGGAGIVTGLCKQNSYDTKRGSGLIPLVVGFAVLGGGNDLILQQSIECEEEGYRDAPLHDAGADALYLYRIPP